MGKEQNTDKKEEKNSRIFFEPGKRPILKVKDHNFEIKDISEKGIIFLVNEELNMSSRISGTISFFKGDTIDISGELTGVKGNAVKMAFNEPISHDDLVKNQEEAYLKTDIIIPQFVEADGKEKGYSTKYLQKLGISVDLLKSWMIQGYFSPSIKDDGGSKNTLSRFDFYIIKLLEYLINLEISEEEASIKTKILVKLVKNSQKLFSESPSLAFASKLDFNSIDQEDKDKLFDLLSGNSVSKEDSKRLTGIMKKLAPIFADEKKKAEILETFEKGDEVIIVDLKKIRDQVDAVLDA